MPSCIELRKKPTPNTSNTCRSAGFLRGPATRTPPDQIESSHNSSCCTFSTSAIGEDSKSTLDTLGMIETPWITESWTSAFFSISLTSESSRQLSKASSLTLTASTVDPKSTTSLGLPSSVQFWNKESWTIDNAVTINSYVQIPQMLGVYSVDMVSSWTLYFYDFIADDEDYIIKVKYPWSPRTSETCSGISTYPSTINIVESKFKPMLTPPSLNSQTPTLILNTPE